MPKTATSATAGCCGEHLLDLGGIDVHAARDDHVRRAIAEIDEAVGVHPADVAEREHAGFEIGARGLLGVAVVDERLGHVAVSRVERADLAGRQPAAVVVHRERFPVWQHAAHRAGMRQPLLRIDQRDDAALGAAPVFDQHGAPPLDHALLHDRRDRRRAVQHEMQRRRAERGALGVGETQQPHEHRRHEMRVVDLALAKELQRARLVPARHHDHRRAVQHVVDREEQRRGVIERTGDEMRPAAVEADHRARAALRLDRRAERRRPRAAHALGLPAGAARVHHRAARRTGGIERRIGRRGERALEFVAGDDHLRGARRARRRRVLRVGDHHARARVRQHVRDLLRPQVAVHRRDPEPRRERADHRLDRLGAIAHQHRDVRRGRQRRARLAASARCGAHDRRVPPSSGAASRRRARLRAARSQRATGSHRHPPPPIAIT